MFKRFKRPSTDRVKVVICDSLSCSDYEGNNRLISRYRYDGLSRLIREDNVGSVDFIFYIIGQGKGNVTAEGVAGKLTWIWKP